MVVKWGMLLTHRDRAQNSRITDDYWDDLGRGCRDLCEDNTGSIWTTTILSSCYTKRRGAERGWKSIFHASQTDEWCRGKVWTARSRTVAAEECELSDLTIHEAETDKHITDDRPKCIRRRHGLHTGPFRDYWSVVFRARRNGCQPSSKRKDITSDWIEERIGQW